VEERVEDVAIAELLSAVDGMESIPHGARARIADRRDGAVYRMSDRIVTALKVSLVTGRPLLMVGPPGCGKSSLAAYVARNLKFWYFEFTVAEDSNAQDLLWEVDQVGRLNDAQVGSLRDVEHYVRRGPLWRAFVPLDDVERPPPTPPEWGLGGCSGAIVLIDEIDKAATAISNSLLVALGSLQFDVPVLKRTVRAAPNHIVMPILTSNDERAIPPAMLRRSIVVAVDPPSAEALLAVTRLHFPDWMNDATFESRVTHLADRLVGRPHEQAQVSTAEFLDLVQALYHLPESDSSAWTLVEDLVVVDRTGPDRR
jgi:MoxR-like ATPase